MGAFISSLLLGVSLAATMAVAQADNETHHKGVLLHVTITNITMGESFTPFLVVSHQDEDHLLFTPGAMAGDALSALAEAGDTGQLQTQLMNQEQVHDTATSAGLLEPGHSVTVPIWARPGRDHISLAAMLIPTNDGFVSVQNVAVPSGREAMSLYAPAYDAGSEPNDELCISIPGPVCGGEGASPGVGGEGYVHIHHGIHGIGDLIPAERDWRNPVASIVIQRAQ